ncbi:FAD-dependent oxidoreductase [Sulfitobacter guttiformis]|uniref:Fumarate reductase flavoprotein subunit n=1 Tax=Sulfitobacter guttiformis TaxID=74349 RepID=A0A420DT73_9RHOB|nr:FAD-dependent oxidoreductase [Sulfitobacter guttiformis]KIN71040.1 3-ketosteroid dehydrogenase [Sulfitobacter guttiformis KCTC 32187]RKE97524.1 fumarate reductase flavoprotein subunit [Sulfitobacter guttiformis]
MAHPEIAPPQATYDIEVETLIIGAGAAGMIAALRAHEAGQDVLLIEADPLPSGSTALSAGLIPAAGTALQQKAGIADDPALFAADIQHKAHNENEQTLVDVLAQNAAPVIDWLTDTHGLPFSVVTDFDYPGHSRRRMHGLPTRSGAELVDALRHRIEDLGIPLICERRAVTLYSDGTRVDGIQVLRPDGAFETIKAGRLILACNGFGGNRAMVTQHMPEIDGGLWFGHDGNNGDAVSWGEKLGAATRHLGAYQGHGNVAHPHGILITWAVITEGGFQVNRDGLRFWNEAQGYSEAARAVLEQPDGFAWAVFDARIANIAQQFADFKLAQRQGAVVQADTLDALDEKCGFEQGSLGRIIAAIPRDGTDAFGRRWTGQHLTAPFCAVKVTGALFHTQGGLDIDPVSARVRMLSGGLFDNLYATGGAAVGVSGASDSGYLSGNGLLAASVLGAIAGKG